jgi:hypothetical protein
MRDSNPKSYARRLRDAVENREPADAPELRVPAAESALHAELWRRHALVETVLDAARAHPPEAALADAVLAALATEPSAPPSVQGSDAAQRSRPTSHASLRRRGGMLVVAAAALLLAVVVLRRPVEPPPGDPGSLARRGAGALRDPAPRDVPVAPQGRPDDANELDRLFAEVHAAYHGLAEETRVAVADLGQLVPLPTTDDPAPMPPPDPQPGWFDRVGGGLAPVRENVGRTLDFLLEPVADPTTT